MSTVRKIATEAGVSVGTVSRVLNNHRNVSGDTRRKVLGAMADSGYASPVLARRSVRAVGFVSTGTFAAGGAYDMALLRGIYGALAGHDYNLMVLDAGRNRRPGEPLGQTLARMGICGLLVRTSSDPAAANVVRELAAGPLPAVLVADRGPAGLAVPSVLCDSNAAVRRAVRHLADLGHRRVAITLNVVVDHDHMARYEQWAAALREVGLECSGDLVMRVPADRGAGAVALRQLLAMADRPTAVFVTDPPAAAGLLREALRTGVNVPGDLSVVGFDDDELRYDVFPHLSAVCQDAAALGRLAFDRLDRLVRDDAAGQGERKRRRRKGQAPDVATPETSVLIAGRSAGGAGGAGGAEAAKSLVETIECWYEPHATVGPPPAAARAAQ